MLRKQIMGIILGGVGLTSVAAIIYLAGPFVVIGDWRPLEGYIVREIAVLLLVTAVASASGFRFWKRKKSADKLAEGLADAAPGDEEVLKERMGEALATLKDSSKGSANYLYDLPWYIFIGPPGTGKTTALVNSGLKFPLSKKGPANPISGIGGTRYCDWLFAEDAVFIDTAGRYTTQDSDATADKKSWFAFLDLLKKNRPRQPINGALVAIGLDEIMTERPETLAAHADAIRARLVELHDKLKINFPVYVIFTKADLIAGFREFFSSFGEESRKQVWGATFQTTEKRKNLVGEAGTEFDTLIARLYEMTTDRLQEEAVASNRVSLFGFPAQLATLKKPIVSLLEQIFEPTRYHANATLRGIYFTSGTQQGTPIDQLIGALSRNFGAKEVGGHVFSGIGKSYFLTDLIGKVIIGEASWVSTDLRAVLRQRIIKISLLSLLALGAAGCCLAWWTSYGLNKGLITRTQSAAADYTATAGPLAKEETVADRDLTKILEPLNKLLYLPDGYAARGLPIPLAETFGLSQSERIRSAAERAYHTGLERLLRPRLLYRLEEVLEANRDNPSMQYEALKVYLMLGGRHQPDDPLILSWMRRDWADNLYQGSANSDGRKLLEQHVAAMLDLGKTDDPVVSLYDALIDETQASLARLSITQRAYELLRSQARSLDIPDWNASRQAGPDVALVFDGQNNETLQNITVPGFYTYAGFRLALIDRLPLIAEQLKDERWVLGAAGEQNAVEAQYRTMSTDILDLYTKDFTAAWQKAFSKLRLKRLIGDKPKYHSLAAASAATSPLKRLLESIRDETAVTRDRPGFAKADEKKDEKSDKTNANAALIQTLGKAPGTDIEQNFRVYHQLVDGDATKRPIDDVVSNLAAIYQSLLMATDPSQAQQAQVQLQAQVAALRGNANRLPPPFSTMLQGAAGDFDGDLTNGVHAQLQRALGDQVTGICQQIVNNRYPVSKSDRDIPLADFGKIFGPQGILDKFFQSHLAQYVDQSKREWAFRQDSAIGRALAPSGKTLRQFRLASQIRDTFFANGGLMPSMSLTVIPPPIPSTTATSTTAASTTPSTATPSTTTIKLDVNGTTVASSTGSNSPSVVQWPGAATNHAAVIMTSDVAGAQPSTIERNGPWAIFRLVDAGAPVPKGDRVAVSYVVAGHELQYQFGSGSTQNPFTLSALKEFQCPSEL